MAKYTLDNAAKLYPHISSKQNPNMYRIAVTLTEEVIPEVLEQALNDIMVRFPLFKTRLARGFFWHKLVTNDEPVKLFPMDRGHYCAFPDVRVTNGYRFRVSFEGRDVALEVFHVLSDGRGGLEFLQSLIFRYLFLLGKDVSSKGIKTIDETPTQEELEDSFLVHYDKHNNKTEKEKHAFRITGLKVDGIRVTDLRFSVEEMLALARASGVTITEYLVALFIFSVYKAQVKNAEKNDGKASKKRPIIISVPCDLRKIAPSKTLRNFSSFFKIEYDTNLSGEFGDVLESISKQIKSQNDKNKMIGRMSATVKFEKNPIIRAIPLFLKGIIIRTVFKLVGENTMTTSFSNFGIVRFGGNLEEFVDGFEVNLFSSDCFSLLGGSCTYKDTMQISLNRNIFEGDIEEIFVGHLKEQGIEVGVKVNY